MIPATKLASSLLLAGAAGALYFAPKAITPATAEATAPATTAATYAIDNAHSWTHFRVNHMGIGTAFGQFRKFGGTIVMDEADLTKSSVSITIDADSIDTNNAGRDRHLKGGDFFSVKEFPEITFTSTAVKPGKKGVFAVTGLLKMHGTEKEVTAEVRQVGSGKGPRGQQRAGFEARFSVNRLDFGVDYMPQGLGKEVTVELAIEGVLGS